MKLIEVNFKIASILIDCEDLNTALKDVFSLVGDSIDADRIYYFNIYKNDDDKFYTSQKIEWVKGGVEPMIDNPDLQNIPLEVLDIFISPLLSNNPFEAIVNELKAYKQHKDTPQAKKHVENLKKLNAVKNKLEAELDNSVTSLYRDAELKAED